jgi:hypothetical protein
MVTTNNCTVKTATTIETKDHVPKRKNVPIPVAMMHRHHLLAVIAAPYVGLMSHPIRRVTRLTVQECEASRVRHDTQLTIHPVIHQFFLLTVVRAYDKIVNRSDFTHGRRDDVGTCYDFGLSLVFCSPLSMARTIV